jgi:hypothetical protein
MGMFAFLAAALPATETAVNLWLGTWALKDAGDKPETLIYSDAGGGAMRMVSVEAKSIIVTRFDGKPAPDKGAGASEGSALAVKAESPTRYRWIYFRKGKPFVTGINTLRPGGRAFDEVSWLVAKPVEKVTLVYERR